MLCKNNQILESKEFLSEVIDKMKSLLLKKYMPGLLKQCHYQGRDNYPADTTKT